MSEHFLLTVVELMFLYMVNHVSPFSSMFPKTCLTDVKLKCQIGTIDRTSKRPPGKVQNSMIDSQDEESDDSELR